MTDFLTAISNFGFPIVVAAYLLFRFENKIEKFSDRIQGMADVMTEVIEGKPSQGKAGLIQTLEKNTRATEELAKIVDKLKRKKNE